MLSVCVCACVSNGACIGMYICVSNGACIGMLCMTVHGARTVAIEGRAEAVRDNVPGANKLRRISKSAGEPLTAVLLSITAGSVRETVVRSAKKIETGINCTMLMQTLICCPLRSTVAQSL